ncbi:MAG TPA: phosphatidylcholine/phosphatidylserine synthase, partial [Gammaproteobacteria bacterium]|nr:phosphatidylcholine/phosphatidylserine synthase [Gammaproteobacteria bacterium]
AGFYSIIAAMSGLFTAAAIAIFIALVLDGLDGRVARFTGTTSAFGAQYDSLSDLVAFGLAPALLVYRFALSGLADYGWVWAKIGWLAAFFYAVATALRLARFNSRAGIPKRYFQGLPCPSAAALIAGSIWFAQSLGVSSHALAIPALAFTVFAGVLMVSDLGYYSFKELRLDRRLAFPSVLAVPLLFILVTLSPPGVLFGAFLLYALSAPVWWLIRWYRRYRRHA